MTSYDLAFCGNGILSFVSALKVKQQFPSLRIAIVGPLQRPFSASVAAGAMQAVFCEVEDTFGDLSRDREIFGIGLEARTLWRQWIEAFGLRDVVTAEDTVMYRRKQGTPFEQANFDAACAVANDHKCLEDVSQKELNGLFCGKLRPSDVVAKKFMGEFAIDADCFFTQAQALLSKMGVVLVDDRVQKMDRTQGEVRLGLASGASVTAGRVVVAAGSESAKILPPDFAMVPLYQAVGTAMVLDSAPSSYPEINLVVRTPNRGGAQCGMHIVPRNSSKFYLGAGSYLSDKEAAHRVETIRYLIDICEQELFGKQIIYGAKAELLLGSRPKSMDGFPIMGVCEGFPEIFVATGTYRIGLTIAPVIANEVGHWYETGTMSARFKSWSPDRALHSYAPMDVAVRYYSESRISNLIEHGLLRAEDSAAVSAKKIELENVAKNLNAEVVRKHGLPAEFVVDPDMYALLAAAEPLKLDQARSKT